ncbi:MAG: hypothetical protein KDD04_12560, partial [Sinomicrobium sp.]|nr:hypothetical protein [Sinomicrobium sp.]
GVSDWVVSSPSGLFDASPGAMQQMYYVLGLEIIELNQLKERYYEPGLLGKLMGFNKEPIRDVAAMDEQLELYPELTVALEGTQLKINLKEREGGMGRVALKIGNKEVEQDINPNKNTFFQLDLKKYERYFIMGQETKVSVQVWDRENGLSGQFQSVSYTLEPREKGRTNTSPGATTTKTKQARLFALCIGSGDYNGGDKLDLSYAEQDARQMANAIKASGKGLFIAAPPEVITLT